MPAPVSTTRLCPFLAGCAFKQRAEPFVARFRSWHSTSTNIGCHTQDVLTCDAKWCTHVLSSSSPRRLDRRLKTFPEPKGGGQVWGDGSSYARRLVRRPKTSPARKRRGQVWGHGGRRGVA